jgi:flagellar assembly protein FliH
MSARLIKGDAIAPFIEFAPFIPKQDAPAKHGRAPVVPFVPKSSNALVPETATAARAHAPQHTGVDAIGSADASHRTSDITAARSEAARIIAEARALAEQIKEEARETGLAEARADLDEEMAQVADHLHEQLAETINEVSDLRASIFVRAERDLVKLAIEIAKKIVHREVTIDDEVAMTLARVALSRIDDRAHARVHLHPDDFTHVSRHLDGLATGKSIELVEDRAITRGGCLIKTEIGNLDARIERQFEELERSFLGV